jgi:hypothetical protein
MTKDITKEQEEEVISLILNTWDFCGIIQDALNDWQAENDVYIRETENFSILEEAKKRWNESLK